jgi:hypothetical protein
MSLGLIVFIAVLISIFLGLYYFSLIISIAIWFPDKAKIKWVELTHSPGINEYLWFWKWIAPAWLIAIALSTALIAVKLVF